jgi:hypothetical protein
MSWFLKKILQKLNSPIRIKLYEALQHVQANRPIESINTLIIGDLCKDRMLMQLCQSNQSIKIMRPKRSLESSKLILAHFTSVLREGGKVIIIDLGSKEGVSCLDYPFLSQISRLELNLSENSKRISYPLLFFPLQCIRLMFGLGCSKIHEAECPDNEIVEICNRKQFKLMYLSNK